MTLSTTIRSIASIPIGILGRKAVTLTKPSYTGDNQTFDPPTGTYIVDEGEEAGDPVSGTVYAVFPEITQEWQDKFPITSGDAVAVVAAGGLEPEQNDVLDGWTILAVEKVKPAEAVIVYRCHLRKQ